MRAEPESLQKRLQMCLISVGRNGGVEDWLQKQRRALWIKESTFVERWTDEKNSTGGFALENLSKEMVEADMSVSTKGLKQAAETMRSALSRRIIVLGKLDGSK